MSRIDNFNINSETVVTIGKFDGLHSGHLRVIDKLLEVSKDLGLSSVIYTFNLNIKSIQEQAKEQNTCFNVSVYDDYLYVTFAEGPMEEVKLEYIEGI